jgi:hypothetical protein
MVEQHQHIMQLNSKSWNYTPSCRLFCIAIKGSSVFSSSGQSFRTLTENTKFCRLAWLCYYLARDQIVETQVRTFLSSAYSYVKHICMYVHTHTHTYWLTLLTYLLSYSLTHLLAYLLTYLVTNLLIYLLNYLPTYLPTYLCIYFKEIVWMFVK